MNGDKKMRTIEVHILPSLLQAGEKVSFGSKTEPVHLSQETLLLWVDLAPELRFAHPTCTVLISESDIRVLPGDWWTKIDDVRRFPEFGEVNAGLISPLKLGDVRVHVLPLVVRPEDGLSDGPGTPEAQGSAYLPIHGESVVLWIDSQPGVHFPHDTRYVILSYHAPNGAQVVQGSWWPTWRGGRDARSVPTATPARWTLSRP